VGGAAASYTLYKTLPDLVRYAKTLPQYQAELNRIEQDALTLASDLVWKAAPTWADLCSRDEDVWVLGGGKPSERAAAVAHEVRGLIEIMWYYLDALPDGVTESDGGAFRVAVAGPDLSDFSATALRVVNEYI
jgi:hypothetical protein